MMTSRFNSVSNGDSINVYKKNASMNPNTVSPIANHNYKNGIINLNKFKNHTLRMFCKTNSIIHKEYKFM